jgi:hypothetical protein
LNAAELVVPEAQTCLLHIIEDSAGLRDRDHVARVAGGAGGRPGIKGEGRDLRPQRHGTGGGRLGTRTIAAKDAAHLFALRAAVAHRATRGDIRLLTGL